MCFLPILKYILLKKSGEMPSTQIFEAQYLKNQFIYCLQILHVYSRTSFLSKKQMARQFGKEHEYLYIFWFVCCLYRENNIINLKLVKFNDSLSS